MQFVLVVYSSDQNIYLLTSARGNVFIVMITPPRQGFRLLGMVPQSPIEAIRVMMSTMTGHFVYAGTVFIPHAT